MTPNLPSRPRPLGEKARYTVPPELINKLSREQGYNFAEATHNRAEQLKQTGYISWYWEGILNDSQLAPHYTLEVYWLKPPPDDLAYLEQFKQPARLLPSPG